MMMNDAVVDADGTSSVWRIAPTMKSLLPLLDVASPGAARWLCFWNLTEALATVGIPYSTKRLVESVTAAQGAALLTYPLIWLAVELSLASIRIYAERGVAYQAQLIETRGKHAFTVAVLEKACNVAYSRFEVPAFVNRLTQAREHATIHVAYFAIQMFNLIGAAVIFLGCLALLITVSAWSLPVLLLAAVPAYAFETFVARRAFELENATLQRNRRGWYIDWLLTAEATAKEIRMLAAGRWLVGLYARTHEPFQKARAELAKVHRRGSRAAALAGVLALYGPYAFIVVQAVQNRISVGEMLLFAMAFQAGSASFARLLGALATCFEKELAVRSFLRFLATPEEDRERDIESEPLLASAPELNIEDVWFEYPGAKAPVLRGLNLRVTPGTTLAIVGANGSGKTTLVKLLLGLYPFQRGKITLDGIDVSTQSTGWLRQNVAVVFQDFVRFQFSAASNVGIGWVPECDDVERINRAIDTAGARVLIDNLPDGLESPLGAAFGGGDLSGGQWQKIALARLLMRKSRLWILDEPTSAMDPDTEERTFGQFRRWAKDRTAIIISHRFATVRVADRIAVIRDGQVAEIGTHEELLQHGGEYARMFEAQAATYRSHGSPNVEAVAPRPEATDEAAAQF